MAAFRMMTFVGGLIVTWSLVIAFVLVEITETPPGFSLVKAFAADPTTLLLAVSDLSAFVVGLGILLCGLIAEFSLSRSRRLLHGVVTFAIGYGCAVAAGAIVLVWLDTRSLFRTLLWFLLATVMGTLWIVMIRSGQRYILKQVLGSAENRQQ